MLLNALRNLENVRGRCPHICQKQSCVLRLTTPLLPERKVFGLELLAADLSNVGFGLALTG
jgi:hypothetical protein